MPNLIVANFTS